MVTIHVLNIEGKGTLPIHGDGKPETLAAGYDVVAVDDPTIVGEVGRVLKLEDGIEIPLYKNIRYLEYHTALKIQPLHNAPEEYHHVDLYPRSSVRKYNLVLANSIGIIDNDYRGEILVSFKYIFQPEDFVIEFEELEKGYKPTSLLGGINWTNVYRKGDKIAQLVAEKTNPINFVFTAELTITARGEGGHGSTGQKANTTLEPYNGLADLYNKAGGIPTQKRYIDRVKERERMSESRPVSNTPVLPTGIRERKP
jgi:dUTP pyrophosphatase